MQDTVGSLQEPLPSTIVGGVYANDPIIREVLWFDFDTGVWYRDFEEEWPA